MPKWKNRICEICKSEDFTASKSTLCLQCFAKTKKQNKVQHEKQHLESIGYKILSEPVLTQTGHRKYELVAPCCQRQFSPTYPNILKQLASGTQVPCKWCGGEKRISKAMEGYLKLHAADYDLEEYAEYCRKVRRLSEDTYRKNKHIINPLNLVRGRSRGKHHLDHKVSIIWCFKNKITPEVAAGINNLHMLPMEKNLEKGRKNISDEEAQQLLFSTSVSSLLNTQVPEWKGKVAHDYENVFDTQCITIRESEYINSPDAVLSRLNYALGKIDITVGARNLDIRNVELDEEKQFFSKWHSQGYAPSKTALGLYRDSELIAIMSFCTPRYKQAAAQYELLRYAVKGGYSVPGGASRLFKTWCKANNFPSVVSYSLNRWGKGEMYEKLGFEKIASTPSPSFVWHDGKHMKWRASVLRAKRTGTDLKTLTKIHDPGSTTWLFRGKPDA